MSDDASVWAILGKRWTLPILKIAGSAEPVRFCQIKKSLAGISNTVLSGRLFELEQEGLVARNVHGSKVEYSLTVSGRELEFMLAKLERWWRVHRTTYQSVVAVSVE